MANYSGPVCRLCRREDMKLFLKGDRCYTDKCGYERRAYAPGQHGQARRRKLSMPRRGSWRRGNWRASKRARLRRKQRSRSGRPLPRRPSRQCHCARGCGPRSCSGAHSCGSHTAPPSIARGLLYWPAEPALWEARGITPLHLCGGMPDGQIVAGMVATACRQSWANWAWVIGNRFARAARRATFRRSSRYLLANFMICGYLSVRNSTALSKSR